MEFLKKYLTVGIIIKLICIFILIFTIFSKFDNILNLSISVVLILLLIGLSSQEIKAIHKKHKLLEKQL